MTDNEVIKALGICGNFENCKDCSLSDVGDVDKCIHTLLLNSLDLINRQKAEIDKLNKKVEELSEVLSGSIKIKAKEIKSEAIKYFKRGFKVKRVSWNGKSQYIELASNISYQNTVGETINCEHAAIGNKAIVFVGTIGTQMGWLASQADMLAEDWCLVE